jgi:hypothetical protein
VLVGEWVEGEGFDTMKSLPDADRNRIGETIYRFTMGSFNRTAFVNTDVHPGNYRLRADGSIAFIDFGNCKEFAHGDKAAGVAAIAATIDRDEEGLRKALISLRYLRGDEQRSLETLMRQAWMLGGWYLEDRELQITPELVGEGVAAASDPRSGLFELRKLMLIPPDEIWVRRIETGVFAVLGHLNATANWHRIAREWWFNEPPQTELGRLETEWLATKGLRPDGEPLS